MRKRVALRLAACASLRIAAAFRLLVAALSLAAAFLPSVAAAQGQGVTLTVNSITWKDASVTIANYTGVWWYALFDKTTDAPRSGCILVGENTTATVTSLKAATTWILKAYSRQKNPGKCEGKLASVDIKTKSSPLSVTEIGTTTAKITLTGFTGTWSYVADSQSCVMMSEGYEATLTNLSAGTPNGVYVWDGASCGSGAGSEYATASFTTAEAGLTASAVTHNSATLTLSHHWKEKWRYKRAAPDAADAQCSSEIAKGTSTANVTGLEYGTAYTYKAYRDDECTIELTNDNVDAEFTTLSPALSVDNVTAATARLTLANWTAAWHYRYTTPDGGQCSPAVAAGTSTVTLSGLEYGTAYTYKAYRDDNCTVELTNDNTDAAFHDAVAGAVG